MRVYVYVYTRKQDVRMCVALHTARDHDIVQLRYGTLIQPLSPPPPNPLLQNLLHLSARTHDPPHSLTLLRHLASRNFVSDTPPSRFPG